MTTLTPLEVLKAGRALISDINHWTTGVFARNNKHQPTKIDDPNAVCFCSSGAIMKSLPEGPERENLLADSIIYLRGRMNGSVVDYNDSCSHSVVLEAWDKAIADCELDTENETL